MRRKALEKQGFLAFREGFGARRRTAAPHSAVAFFSIRMRPDLHPEYGHALLRRDLLARDFLITFPLRIMGNPPSRRRPGSKAASPSTGRQPQPSRLRGAAVLRH
jgi:hypothetical protein